MKKLAGLLAFAVALAAAILVTQYYTARTKRPEPPPAPPAPAQPAQPAAPAAAASVAVRPQLVTLDLASKKASVTLALELNQPAAAAPERVWVWAYFFTQEASGKYCEGGPVEVRKPFDAGSTRARVTVELPVTNCPAPRTPSTTFYARVNVSAESSFAARLPEQRISYDISQASPVILQGARK
ncbi:MAG TPA: hypothetical protein VM936_14125 [Pyrinomonadaceae bacterium]|nr:hypothetical protein [Pyrinomonadaceae bacterium]